MNRLGTIIEVKANPRLSRIGLIVTILVILICIWFTYDSLFSGSNYRLLGFLGGGAGTFFGFYFLIHSAPVFFRKDKTLFEIVPGPDGRIQSKDNYVEMKDIKDVRIQHKGVSLRSWLYYDLVIFTKQNKKIRIKTYNVLHEQDFMPYKRDYITPFIN
ncbi:hypothetical protein CEF21_20705 [Bacillus sp. FJAT-42376]|uniref:DUF5381 family protein n=1 Tax=Bacillus sp. FJAT-42376 TaxID=2014076 RepID=UPI000F4DA487|nr:DUF5381 family protein [Bacillus sp. FJAT-42376]AZB44515.1 hypothetical protein CEF21_20705 [Bacillus sp. FJAT-42376]